MEQRDVIKDQIDQLGKVIGKIIADVLNLSNNKKDNSAIEASIQQLNSEIDFDVITFSKLSKEEALAYLSNLKIHPDHYEKLSAYYYKLGILFQEGDMVFSKQCFQKSLDLIDLLETKTETTSFEQMGLRKKLIETLNAIE